MYISYSLKDGVHFESNRTELENKTNLTHPRGRQKGFNQTKHIKKRIEQPTYRCKQQRCQMRILI